MVLAENGETLVVAAYKRYRKQRELARKKIRVRDPNGKSDIDVTDQSLLLVESTSENMTLPWDRARIVQQSHLSIGTSAKPVRLTIDSYAGIF